MNKIKEKMPLDEDRIGDIRVLIGAPGTGHFYAVTVLRPNGSFKQLIDENKLNRTKTAVRVDGGPWADVVTSHPKSITKLDYKPLTISEARDAIAKWHEVRQEKGMKNYEELDVDLSRILDPKECSHYDTLEKKWK